MIRLQGRPILYWTLNWLKKYRFKHVVLGVAYRKEAIINYVEKNPFGLNVDFSEHTVEGETGEGFRLAIERYVDDNDFLAMNGDEITNLNLERMVDSHLKQKPVATIAVSPLRSPFGIVHVQETNVISFDEKPVLEDRLVSAGIYIFNHKIIEYLPKKGSLERLTFPLLAQQRLLKAYKLTKNELWITVNSIKDLSLAEEKFELVKKGWK